MLEKRQPYTFPTLQVTYYEVEDVVKTSEVGGKSIDPWDVWSVSTFEEGA